MDKLRGIAAAGAVLAIGLGAAGPAHAKSSEGAYVCGVAGVAQSTNGGRTQSLDASLTCAVGESTHMLNQPGSLVEPRAGVATGRLLLSGHGVCITDVSRVTPSLYGTVRLSNGLDAYVDGTWGVSESPGVYSTGLYGPNVGTNWAGVLAFEDHAPKVGCQNGMRSINGTWTFYALRHDA